MPRRKSPLASNVERLLSAAYLDIADFRFGSKPDYRLRPGDRQLPGETGTPETGAAAIPAATCPAGTCSAALST